MFSQVPLFDLSDPSHVTGIAVAPLLLLFLAAAVAGFFMGLRRRRVFFMLVGTGVMAGLGYRWIGSWGLLAGSPMPLAFAYGRS